MRPVSYFRAGLLAATALSFCGLASAQSGDDLEARIAALETMVQELKGELAAERASTDADLVRVEKVAADAAAAAPAAPTKGFRVGDATLSFGGYVDFDAIVQDFSSGSIPSNSIARDFYIPGAVPVGGQGTTQTDFTAQSSRFFFDASQEVGGKKVSAHIELDFLGSVQGDERVTSSYSPRLRRAYLDIDGKWRVGQEWTTFQNLSAIPESASFLVLSDGMIFNRQPMIRYTSGNWQFAIENGDTTITTLAGGRIEADSNLLPDGVIRYNISGDFGNVSLSGLVRQLRYEVAGSEEDTLGWAVSASGLYKVGAKDDIRFNLVAGEGVGRYVGLNSVNAAALNPAGGLDAIPVYGGYIAWRHPFGDTARFNVGYSGLFADNPDFLGAGTTKQTQSAFAAVLWDIAPKVTLGTEVMYGIRELESGAEGEVVSFTFSTKYAF